MHTHESSNTCNIPCKFTVKRRENGKSNCTHVSWSFDLIEGQAAGRIPSLLDRLQDTMSSALSTILHSLLWITCCSYKYGKYRCAVGTHSWFLAGQEGGKTDKFKVKYFFKTRIQELTFLLYIQMQCAGLHLEQRHPLWLGSHRIPGVVRRGGRDVLCAAPPLHDHCILCQEAAPSQEWEQAPSQTQVCVCDWEVRL